MKAAEEKEKMIASLKAIINEELGVSVSTKRRKRELVDARMIYTKILTDMGFSRTMIGLSIGKDHATIVHYVANMYIFFNQDSVLLEKFRRCRDSFFDCYDPIYGYDDKSLRTEILILRKQIKLLLLDQEKLRKYEIEDAIFKDIFKLIKENFRASQKDEFVAKLKTLFYRM